MDCTKNYSEVPYSGTSLTVPMNSNLSTLIQDFCVGLIPLARPDQFERYIHFQVSLIEKHEILAKS